MHIAIDAVGSVSGGGWTVLSRLLREVRDDARVRRITVFGSPKSELRGPVPSGPIDWLERPREHAALAARVAWYERGLDRACRALSPEVVVCMNGMGRTKAPRIQVVQQAFSFSPNIVALAPPMFALRQAAVRRLTLRACRTARRVVVQTSWMREAAQRELGHEHDVRALALGLPRPGQPGTGRGPVVCFANDLPYKRRSFALSVFDALRRRRPEVELVLVDDELSNDEVDYLLERAIALLAPSDVESLGLPVVEAFAAHCPVVAADRPWARGLGGDAALYFRPGDGAGAVELLSQLIDDVDLRETVAELGVARLEELWHPDPYRGLIDLCEEIV